MERRIDVEAPTLNSLNSPQRRALVLRDYLRFTETHHLDTLIEGVTDCEPPQYKMVGNTIQPALAMVTLKESATKLSLGNVLFPEEGNKISRTWLVIEQGRVEMRTEDALPLINEVVRPGDAVPESVPIHAFIASTMVTMFKGKFETVLARMNRINGARRAAYDMAKQVPAPISGGKTLGRLDPKNTAARKATDRKPGQPVPKHIANKHKDVEIDTIPNTVKSASFNTIPEAVKVDLFNKIANTAFPGYNNLMTAAWNVVSIYSACGTDFPDLHRAIVDLKSVLQDFDEKFGTRVDRIAPELRHDWGGPASRAGGSCGAVRDVRHRSAKQRSRVRGANISASREAETENYEHDHDGASDDPADQPGPSHQITPLSQDVKPEPDQDDNDEDEDDDSEQDDFVPARKPSPPQLKRPRPKPSAEALTRRPSTTPHHSSRGGTPTSSNLHTPKKKQKTASTTSVSHTPAGLRALLPPTLPTQPPTATTTPTTSTPILSSTPPSRPSNPTPLQFSSISTPDTAPISATEEPRSTPESLRTKYTERKAQLVHAFGDFANIPAQHKEQLKKIEEEAKRVESESGGGGMSESATSGAGAGVLGKEKEEGKDAGEVKWTGTGKEKEKEGGREGGKDGEGKKKVSLGHSILGARKK